METEYYYWFITSALMIISYWIGIGVGFNRFKGEVDIIVNTIVNDILNDYEEQFDESSRKR